MKAFRFPLQPLRVIREQREQTALKKYATALRSCEAAADQLHAASAELAAGWSALCQEMGEGSGVNQLCRTRAWCDALEVRRKECGAALDAARKAVDESLKALMRASTERQALERLREKALQAHGLAAQRAEQATLDEMATRLSAFPGALRFGGPTDEDRNRR